MHWTKTMRHDRETDTTCPYCGVGCGLKVRVTGEREIQLRGDETHPANFGRLCVKGAALPETMRLDGRLLEPEVRGTPVAWETALDAVANGFAETIRKHGPDSVAFYLSGQLLTEDYYVANKLMKGFIGSANIDSNSRLCMASTVAGNKRAFGADVVPGRYEDLELADLVIFAGSNAAWCHPVLFQRVAEARKSRPEMKVVVIDPRRTATCDIADWHLAIAPGSDTTLWNGLLHHLFVHGCSEERAARRATMDADALEWAHASAPSPEAVGRICGISAEDVARFYRLFENNSKVVTVFSQGINQSSDGTDKVNAILNAHLLTGRYGRPGTGPLSLTGQPNAMGGREVGALANQLAAHMDLDNPIHRALVSRFWNSDKLPGQPGLKAVEMFQAMADGRIKAVWIMGTNPAVSLPDSLAVKAALERCELVVVSEVMQRTDTAVHADILLPALAWGEKTGTVTNSERRISRQRGFLPAPGSARADWWMIDQVGKRMGFEEAFNFDSPAEIFSEFAALTRFENRGVRLFNLGALADQDRVAYETMQPVQWPVDDRGIGTERLFGAGNVPTPSGRSRIVTVISRPARNRGQSDPLILNTGRIRDQWHTMTRTGYSPRLSRHRPEPVAEIHPLDAERRGIVDGGLVQLKNGLGQVVMRAGITARQRPGEIFAPMHWNREFALDAGVNALVRATLDPVSGQPESKRSPVQAALLSPAWYGVGYSRDPVTAPEGLLYCSRSMVIPGIWRFVLAGMEGFNQWPRVAGSLFPGAGKRLEYRDTGLGLYRCAALDGDRLGHLLFMGTTPPKPCSDMAARLFDRPAISAFEQRGLLAGGGKARNDDEGPTVCACHNVGRDRIQQVIGKKGLTSVEEIGRVLKAGTGCGSCLPELRELLVSNRHSVAIPA